MGETKVESNGWGPAARATKLPEFTPSKSNQIREQLTPSVRMTDLGVLGGNVPTRSSTERSVALVRPATRANLRNAFGPLPL